MLLKVYPKRLKYKVWQHEVIKVLVKFGLIAGYTLATGLSPNEDKRIVFGLGKIQLLMVFLLKVLQ